MISYYTILLIFLIAIQSTNQVDLSGYNETLSTELTAYNVAVQCHQDKILNWNCGKPCSMYPGVEDIDIMYNSTDDILGYVAHVKSEDKLIIIFRGTLPFSIKDWKQDFTYKKVNYPNCNNNCQVHEGFYKSFLSIKEQFWSKFNKIRSKYPDSKLYVSGHSLGGSLAIMAASELMANGINDFIFYTFGSPRVGDEAFSQWFSSTYEGTYYRVTKGRDPVPHLPPMSFGFIHDGQEIFYPDFKKGYKVCNPVGEDSSCSDKYWFPINILEHMDYMGFNNLFIVFWPPCV